MLPGVLEKIPLRVSFLPMSGCAHSCSFCADNSGKTVRMHPFDRVRRSLGEMPLRLESAALYNACDALTYRWHEGQRKYDITHLARLFRDKGCGTIYLSSPGIENSPDNTIILRNIAEMREAVPMLSFNREHLLDRGRMADFLFTARIIMEKRRCAVRVVYCSPGERAALLDALKNKLGREGAFDHRSKRGLTLEAVPAAPLGRGRRLYFGKELIDGTWSRDIEGMIMEMYARETNLRDLGFMTAGGYDSFLRHAAVQFSGFYIILLKPTAEGMDIALKVTDLDKAVATRGLSHSTLYRFDPQRERFVHRTPGGAEKTVKLVVFESARCSGKGFREYLDAAGAVVDRTVAMRVFSSFLASDFMQDKNRVGEGRHMLIMDREYLDFYRETLETIIRTRHPGLERDCGDAGTSIGDVFKSIAAFLRTIGEEC
jgi:hypothetical protein